MLRFALVSIAQRYIENYFKRFADRNELIQTSIDSNCKLIIVIPCHNEPDLLGTLDSLLACQAPNCKVEVIAVVNEPIGSENLEVGKQNRETIKSFERWSNSRAADYITFHMVQALDMPKKTAGVGLARKTGMDEALRRFISIDVDGTIVCLDADCRVSKNYLVAIEEEFNQKDAKLGEVHYEHPFQNEKDEALKKGIINYELFLRYYVAGLKFSGFPYAIQTIGSCMLVKASTYAKHAGMNKRKAGEDFYFLHKIIPHEIFIEVNSATVYPSCRVSDRVPFGTGKAQQDWLDQEEEAYLTYDPKVFTELKSLIDTVPQFYSEDLEKIIDSLPIIPKGFIKSHGFTSKIELIKSNCKIQSQFQKQFFIWFDGFLCMKFVHFTRDTYYPNILIGEAIEKSNLAWDERTRQLIEAI